MFLVILLARRRCLEAKRRRAWRTRKCVASGFFLPGDIGSTASVARL